MKNINLSEIVRKRVDCQAHKIAVVSASKNIQFSDLSVVSQALRGRSVVLYMEDIASLIKLMFLLDGSVKTICPISTSLKRDDLDHLLSIGRFDVVVTDMPESILKPFLNHEIEIKAYEEVDAKTNNQLSEVPLETIWLVPTSGTSSRPKLIKHTTKSLSASALRQNPREDTRQIWGLFYDPTRFAGYQTVFYSVLNGNCLVSLSNNANINEMVEMCVERKVTHISATPTQWRKILMSLGASKMPLKKIILGGEAADQSVLDALRKNFPKAKITHTYASTEAGLGISVSDDLAGYPMKYLDSLEGRVNIQIKNGRLYLRSLSTAKGYHDGTKFQEKDGWIDTGDLVKIEGDRFYVIGRANGTINVGGDKVNPSVVRDVLLKHPKVAEARVYGKKNPITGMLLAADVILEPGEEANEAKRVIYEFVNGHLQKKDCPRIIRIVEKIDIDATGKMGYR